MAAVTLFAWATPAFFKESVVDHTWVTAYDNRILKFPDIQSIISASNHYWYCWGSFHPSGGTPDNADGFLAKGIGSLPYAQCICKENSDSRQDRAAQGTIFTYGIDGVCHQLANQVLWATGANGNAPATVSSARGYWFSTFLFGAYGKRQADWVAKYTQCQTSWSLEMETRSSGSVTEDFETHVRSVITGPGSEEKVRQLITHRTESMDKIEKLQNTTKLLGGGPSADDLNKLYSSFLQKAASILGEDDFKRVFGQSPSDVMNIVDPDIYNAASGSPGEPTDEKPKGPTP
ncbi:hypothetical protein [Burkholderia territorii]|uniref:hypothetical protein n=1 Tax=Burkholderia territorii TaxID=1503055 RepID=UPI000A3F146C|nr:hypothetical protein [Burkholderia territorii]